MVLVDKLTLEKAVSLLEGLETGKASNATLKPGAVVEVSAVVKADHQRVKVASKLGTVSQPCKCCGSKSNSSGLQERREKCLAFNLDCWKCGKIGHFGHCCLAPVEASEAIKD